MQDTPMPDASVEQEATDFVQAFGVVSRSRQIIVQFSVVHHVAAVHVMMC